MLSKVKIIIVIITTYLFSFPSKYCSDAIELQLMWFSGASLTVVLGNVEQW